MDKDKISIVSCIAIKPQLDLLEHVKKLCGLRVDTEKTYILHCRNDTKKHSFGGMFSQENYNDLLRQYYVTYA
jgi:hypothetical protein|tara:strand:+ start:1728 stop:1946 length:219 start_codon:yes stop_codon:yes gene_type:complete